MVVVVVVAAAAAAVVVLVVVVVVRAAVEAGTFPHDTKSCELLTVFWPSPSSCPTNKYSCFLSMRFLQGTQEQDMFVSAAPNCLLHQGPVSWRPMTVK